MLARSGPHPNTKAGTKEAFNEACLRAVVSLTVQSQDRTLNEQEKRQVLDTIENQDGQVGTEGNFSVDAIRHKDDEVFRDGALCVTIRTECNPLSKSCLMNIFQLKLTFTTMTHEIRI